MILNGKIIWRTRFKSSPHKVFQMLTTDEGRASFWAESAIEKEGFIQFAFPNGQLYKSRIYQQEKDILFSIDYFDSTVEFHIEDKTPYTILTLKNHGINPKELEEVNAGWVSVLMSLKCACEYQVDIRNHSKDHTWNEGFVEN